MSSLFKAISIPVWAIIQHIYLEHIQLTQISLLSSLGNSHFIFLSYVPPEVRAVLIFVWLDWKKSCHKHVWTSVSLTQQDDCMESLEKCLLSNDLKNLLFNFLFLWKTTSPFTSYNSKTYYTHLQLRHANQLLLKITLHLFPGWCVPCNIVLWQNSWSLTQINPWDFLPATNSALEEHIKFLNISEN